MWIGIACVDMFGVCALHVYVHVGMSVYGCMWVCTHTCRWARVRACVCACGCACTCMYVDVQVSACGHVQRVYACGHMCEHLCAHACGVSVCGYMWMCRWTCLVCVGIWVHTHAGVHTCVYVACMCACGHVRCVHACVGVYRGPLALPPAGPPLAWSWGPCSQAPGSEALLGPSDILPATPGHLLPAWPSLQCPSRAPTPPQAVRGHQWGPGGLPREGWGLLPAPERVGE